MSPFYPLAKIAESLKQHILMGGTIQDDMGNKLVHKYVYTAQTIHPVLQVIQEEKATLADVETIFRYSIECLMPMPLIKNPMTFLAGSLLFQEPHRLQELLQLADMDRLKGMDKDQREMELCYWTKHLMREIQTAHYLAYGEPNVKIVKAGGLQVEPVQFNIEGLIGFIMLTAIIMYFIFR